MGADVVRAEATNDPCRRRRNLRSANTVKPIQAVAAVSGHCAALESSSAEFVPFLAYDVETRRVICTTNTTESINARYRRAVRARGPFPNETAALKCQYLSPDVLIRPAVGHAG